MFSVRKILRKNIKLLDKKSVILTCYLKDSKTFFYYMLNRRDALEKEITR